MIILDVLPINLVNAETAIETRNSIDYVYFIELLYDLFLHFTDDAYIQNITNPYDLTLVKDRY